MTSLERALVRLALTLSANSIPGKNGKRRRRKTKEDEQIAWSNPK